MCVGKDTGSPGILPTQATWRGTPISVTQGMQEGGAEQRGRADPTGRRGLPVYVHACRCPHTHVHTAIPGPQVAALGWEKAQTQKVESPGLGGSRATVGGGATAHLGV